MDGHAKNIVLKLEEGSAYPDDDFLEEVAEGVREAVKTCGIGSETMTVQKDDLDDDDRDDIGDQDDADDQDDDAND